jgi:hypothetical protein
MAALAELAPVMFSVSGQARPESLGLGSRRTSGLTQPSGLRPGWVRLRPRPGAQQ